MKVVTAGYKYMDIDAYACCVAYAELLNLQGEPAIAACSGPLNESVTRTVREWGAELQQSYVPAADDVFVMVDISEPAMFDKMVAEDRVVEILDHHMERQDYWRRKIGEQAHIEFIGAACTLVYERWKATGRLNEMSKTSARLLATGILDNTLNFEASVTTDRDKTAYHELMERAHLPHDWPKRYFEECQQAVAADIKTALINDSKTMIFPTYGAPLYVGQLVVWNAREVVDKYSIQLISAMKTEETDWFVSVVSIEEGKNYLLAGSRPVRLFLEDLLGAEFVDGAGHTDRLWLRKEIMKRSLDIAQGS